MPHTVIGIFEKGIDAQTAAQKLESNKISPNNIDISNQSTQDTASATTSRRDDDRVGGFFNNLFGNSDDAKKHAEVARRGWVVTVHANSQQEAERAAQTLDSCGAVDVDERAMQLRNNPGQAKPNPTQSEAKSQQRGSEASIPIIEEKTQIGKREVESGGVRLRSRIVERPVEENLRLREERVHVERNKVNRPASEADLKNFKEGETKVTAHSEIPMVDKQARVVEEVKIGKESRERNETVRGTERKTEVDVDKINPKNDLNRDPNKKPNDDMRGPERR